MTRRYRPRARRVIAPVLVLAAAAAVTALLELEEAPAWLAWCPPWLAAVLVAVLGVATTWWFETWAARRQAAVDQDLAAVDLLRRHLGRAEKLPLMCDMASRGLALRVHEAIPLNRAPVPARTPLTRQRLPWLRRRSATASPSALPDPDLPLFVERDVAQDIRAWMRTARTTGGFLVLVGDSSVGKTRLLFETAREVLPDFAVLSPDLGDGGLINTIADATFPLPKLIVWLDELQRYLAGPYFVADETSAHSPLTAGAIRKLLSTDTPVIFLSAIWPETLRTLRSTEPNPETHQQRHRYPQAADVLAAPIHDITVTTFSPTERVAAAALAARDQRLAQAVADQHYGVTETLAGARQIMRRYEQADDSQRAVIHAAADARRLGIQSPLTTVLMRDAARGYLTALQPDDAWFSDALTELTSSNRRDDRATAPVIPLLAADRRTVVGYTVADYLLQQLTRRRRSQQLSAITWEAFATNIHDFDDALRLANSAEYRLLYQVAKSIRTRFADAGDWRAARRLVDLLADRGDIDGLRARADAGDNAAARRLVELLAERGNIDGLRDRLGADLSITAYSFNQLLAERGEIDELRDRADAGDEGAADLLAQLLADRGDMDELRARAEAGHYYAAKLLAALLSHGDDIGELRALADAGVGLAAELLAGMLAERGDFDELQARADAGDSEAAGVLASRLAGQGDIDGLRARADAGDGHAARRLADVLGDRGDADELQARADAGDRDAAIGLAALLADQGDYSLVQIEADAGNLEAAALLAEVLADRGNIDELRARADAGDRDAARRLADLLADRGDMDELRARADAGDTDAEMCLADLLGDRGDMDELRVRADAGNIHAASRLADLLAGQGDANGLWDEVHNGSPFAAKSLILLLRRQGREAEADRLKTDGLSPA